MLNDTPHHTGSMTVTPEEEGLKLLRFLERRLLDSTPPALLHKWIRSGQVRVNSGRTKPFARLSAGDIVRIPPFAQPRELDQKQPVALRNIPMHAETPDFLVLTKPHGLACQGGSALDDSVTLRLSSAFAHQPYVPAPAHRLDRHTSGLVLAGKNHAAQQKLHNLFISGGIHKEYLAWVSGQWPYDAPCLLQDILSKEVVSSGREAVTIVPGHSCAIPIFSGQGHPFTGHTQKNDSTLSAGDVESPGKMAESIVIPIKVLSEKLSDADRRLTDDGPMLVQGATLLRVQLLTGRTHQIRVQLASRGHPVIGDGRYGGVSYRPMLLHAFALAFPWGKESLHFSLTPDWPAPFQVIMADIAAITG